jgi:isocitrate dehydrogenase (NAD+)
MAHRVTLIPGDGIGPEVAAATRLVLEAADVGIEWVEREAGAGALERHGDLLPGETLDAIRASRVALKGPITTPVGTGFRSVNVALRQGLDLFAAVRPARALPGVPIRHPSVDLVVIRENTEDLYAGIEFERGSDGAAGLRQELKELGGYDVPADAGITVKPISVSGTQRIVRFAFEYAMAHGRRKVTVGHKANVMRYSDGLFLQTADQIAAESRGEVAYEAIQIDHLANRLAHDPDRFDVLLLPNLYGDILSDVCAGLVGGLGLIPGANIGWEYAVFEPVHGSAPDIAGRGLADPIAMILSGAMLLRHVGEPTAAENVEWAVDEVLRRGEVRTPDLGGTATTSQVGEEVAMTVTAWSTDPAKARAGRGARADPDRGPEGAVNSRAARGARSTRGAGRGPGS